MKIIFLDIDGVLNSQLLFQRNYDKNKKRKRGNAESKEDYHLEQLDGIAISYLNGLIEKTGAKVVLSSTWRMGNTIEYIRDLLHKKGFKGELIDFTPIHRHTASVRGNEIYQWINDNAQMLCGSNVGSDFKEYVIFDDDSDMLYWQRNNFIQVDAYCGLTPNQCHKAQFILCPEMKFSDSFKK